MKQLKTKILRNAKIAEGFCKMRIESVYLARNSKPGQFVEVKCSDAVDPLLRRPLGVHRILNDGIEMLYEVVGKGTELLSKKRPGDALDVIGPLGNGFLFDPTTQRHNRPNDTILVAGGIGVAPLVALAESLAYSVERIAHREKPKIHVFLGTKNKDHIICVKDFKELGCEIFISTDDGTKGSKGLITDLLRDFLSARRSTLYAIRNTKIYACGPTGMLKEVARLARERRIPCQVSLEERMACGVGVCLGCPVKVRTQYAIRSTQYEYKMVCKDGPVFNAEEVVW